MTHVCYIGHASTDMRAKKKITGTNYGKEAANAERLMPNEDDDYVDG